ncbi:hypothetical protein PORY_000553 [Pneumocystis oryctolagi]|uniref:Uncharacterized protein n=1 Tax=Pneumocystis oryctolagi TaxID=42067 RepID=A0ACB7CH15_9ASCO|nr:hypothetical protein PORY_000553 [Pneumocystis oryctolagi]
MGKSSQKARKNTKSKTKDLKKKKDNILPVNLNCNELSEAVLVENTLKENQSSHQETTVNESTVLYLSALKSSEDQKAFDNLEKTVFFDSSIDEKAIQHITNDIQTFNIAKDENVLVESETCVNSEICHRPSFDVLNSENLWNQERTFFLLEISKLQKLLKDQEDQKNSEIEENEKKIKTLLDEKRQFELQYRNLLGKLSSIKQGLEEKLKTDSENLVSSKQTIENLEKENQKLLKQISHLEEELANANKVQCIATDDIEKYKKLSKDWEEIALEERISKNNFKERLEDLRENIKDHENLLKQERILNTELRKENAQRLQIIDEYKEKINKMIEDHQNDINQIEDEFQSKINVLQDKNLELETRINELIFEDKKNKQEVERLQLFEKEIKEKNLLIGKLKHEAVILNEHLIKALKLIKSGNLEENIDKKLVTNLILSFITLPRNDTKRYEILQLMSSFLQWTDEQKELAGLIRSKNTSDVFHGFNVPLSPLSHDFLNFNYNDIADQDSFNKKSMSDLWIAFLQNETATRNPNLNK